MKKIIVLMFVSLVLLSCSNNENLSDAFGNFDIDGITVSAQASGELVKFELDEGGKLISNQIVGQIDTLILSLKKQQLYNNILSMGSKIQSAKLNLKAMKRQKQLLNKEKKRISDLFLNEATTEQKKDKIFAEYDIAELKIQALEKEIESVQNQENGFNNQLLEIAEKIEKAKIKNPINGTVLVKYKKARELVSLGMPLYKIGNLDVMYLKVYVSGCQLDDIKLGQRVEILIDKDKKTNHKLTGNISWISASSEFTPKNIQTKEERVDQVYAVKILVKNDGRLKIGMPGEVNFLRKDN